MNPNATTRPIAVLRTPIAHATVMQPPGTPDGISVVNYVSMGFPRLAPFIPIYKVRAGCGAVRGRGREEAGEHAGT